MASHYQSKIFEIVETHIHNKEETRYFEFSVIIFSKSYESKLGSFLNGHIFSKVLKKLKDTFKVLTKFISGAD